MNVHIEVIGQKRCRLGESPVWDSDAQALFWVDSMAPSIWRYDPATGEQSEIPAPDKIGSIVLGTPGELIAGLADGIYRVDLATGRFSPIVKPAELTDSERLNDGKADRRGRFITGSLTHMGLEQHVGKLFRFTGGASYEVLPTDPIGISNSICFSPSGDTFYFADSLRGVVWAYEYDLQSGEVGRRRDLIATGSLGSAPDGATVDAEGFVWIALVQAQKLVRVAPNGRVDRVIETPVEFPSCPAFGGKDLDVLYLTSISDSGARFVTAAEDAGRLIAVHGLGVRGVAETRCRL